MSTPLETIGEAIQDAGHWRWWTSDLPAVVQLEFGFVQLYTPPTSPDQPPSSVVALRFHNPISVTFLTFPEAPDDLPADWPTHLQNDTLDPLTISYGSFYFNKPPLAQILLDAASRATPFWGQRPTAADLEAAPILLSFQSGYTGAVITAQYLTIHTHQGEVPLDQIEQKNAGWWAYWQEYWRLRDTPNPLPTDYICEITVPLAE